MEGQREQKSYHPAQCFNLCRTAFDASIAEIFFLLIRGGTICIPQKEYQLNDVGRFISDFERKSTPIAPSFARIIPHNYVSNSKA